MALGAWRVARSFGHNNLESICNSKMNALVQLLKNDKKKERVDIILEPLQVLTQLAFLGFCPKGSKLSVAHNILEIQTPNWLQGVWRTFNNDKRDDVFFLFHALGRFRRIYAGNDHVNDHVNGSVNDHVNGSVNDHVNGSVNDHVNGSVNDHAILCNLAHAGNLALPAVVPLLAVLVVRLAQRGLDVLLETYANAEQPALLHTLHMYRIMLDKPELFAHTEADQLEDMFSQIRTVYCEHEYQIIYHTLLSLEQNPENYEAYLEGLTQHLRPVYAKIQKWIMENMVY
jgi:hypothetical protein